ncbi:MAG: hypothetical protein QNL14_01370 [Deltaproteobacteria bacterium]|jgi:uncharacterized protein YbcC (UPF0753/DUF2309 family)|nr:hypothetical protein [Deltaproteobacteria bacterium]
MVEIRVYGKLRRFVKDIPADSDTVIRLPHEPDETLDRLLARLEIPVDEIYSIFYNSKLLAARSGMASMVGYRQVRGNPYNWDLTVTIHPSDRIGLFGRDMAALVV